MANTFPVADTAGVVEQVWRLGRESGYCDVQPVGAVTVGLEGKQLAELGAMHDSAAGVTVFSDDGKCVDDAVIMRRALEYVKAFDGVVAQHAQEPRLTEGAQMNEGVVSAELGLGGWPAVAEESIIARDVLLAAHVGSRVHICHLSTAGSVEIVRWAKSKGMDVTAEVTPHHLLLTDELVRSYDPVYKVNPPLRTEARRAWPCARRSPTARSTASPPTTPRTRTRTRTASGPRRPWAWSAWRPRCPWSSRRWSTPGCWTGRASPTGCPSRPRAIGRPTGHGRPVSAGEPANLTLVDPAYRGPWTPRASPPAAATPRTRAVSCRAVSRTRGCGAGPRSSTGSSRDTTDAPDVLAARAEVGGGDRLGRPHRLGRRAAALRRARLLADARGLEVARHAPGRPARAARRAGRARASAS